MTELALYVVATPIGNLGDMVPRAIELLQTVDVIAAEDTRHSSRLLSHFGIKTPLISYHDHSDRRPVERILETLASGRPVALISDAGTPLISDPGYRLVRSVREAGFRVVPIPGACALIAALCASGLPSDRFSFEGFLPSRSGQRRKRLQELAADDRTLVFYEAPHRILACLEDMSELFGPLREAALARELTKAFETIETGSLQHLLNFVEADSNQQRGEIVLLVAGAERVSSVMDDGDERVMSILLQQLSVKQASELAAQITGKKKKLFYQWALSQQ